MKMANYWYSRYLETLTRADTASSERVRLAYLDLAEHYQAMHRLCRHYPAEGEYRHAA
jgi:hypothetical protein